MSTASFTTSVLRLDDVSDYLGAPERRFFGEGYKRARHTLTDVLMTAAEDTAQAGPQISARARVSYPDDWSRKGEVDQKAHLSTVDVLLLAAQLAEALLVDHLGLSAGQMRSVWLADVRIQAGRTPLEDGLEDFPVHARIVEARQSATAERAQTVVAATVGPLRARLVADHPDLPRTCPAARRELTDWPAEGVYGDAYRLSAQRIAEVVVHPDTVSATAAVHLADLPAALTGLEGATQPAVGLVDAFVVALQIGQVLLYELDGIDRADSDTLWMRSTHISATTPHRPRTAGGEEPLPLRVELRDAATAQLRGDLWRRADIASHLADITVICSVAHRLPNS
jgi:hypothetical protein